jgi:hypothetical protein
MLKRPLLTALGALALAALFFYGIGRLFVLDYEKGDVYPRYSTLRADPLGARAIYEALGALPGVTVGRNYRPLPRLKPAQPITLVYAGVERHSRWMAKEKEVFEDLIRGGSRAVFTFHPLERRPTNAEEKRDEAEEKQKTEDAAEKEAGKTPDDEKKEGEDEEDESRGNTISFTDVAKEWGFAFDYLPGDEEKGFRRTATLMQPGADLAAEMTWHSAIYFKDLSPEWNVLYVSDHKPVVIERKFGEGSLILAGDTFFLSNEALRNERHAALLARVFSGPPRIVFDEEHLGVVEQPGIATLARKYRLHGAVAALVVLAILFVWKNASRFIPAYDAGRADADVVAGRESAEGFVTLLQRSIPPGEIVGACVAEWRKSGAHDKRARAHMEEALEERAGVAKPNPVETYRKLQQSIARRR